MELKLFLEKGYFPKELPPCFTTKKFSENIVELMNEWNKTYNILAKEEKKDYYNSKCAKFSYPKGELTRRILKVPNPLHYSKLCKVISDNWDSLEEIFEEATTKMQSLSIPKIDGNKRAFMPISKNVTDFQEKRLNLSYDNLYELKVDISKFYDTLYTHSIPWAIHGKEIAKQKQKDEQLLGNKLDLQLRICQDNQTNGIPTGPDASFLVSEIILCKIDEKIMEKKIKFCRFMDDIYIYGNKEEEVLVALKIITKIFNEYELSLNENKIKIRKFPFGIEENWINEADKIKSLIYNKSTQRKAIFSFFHLIFSEMEKTKKDSIAKYLKWKLKDIKIFEENWEIFESLLYKTILICPAVIDIAIIILKKNKDKVNKKKLKKLLKQVLENNAEYGHDYEVIWALWMAKNFEIKINKGVIKEILEKNGPLTCLVAMDMYKKKLVNDNFDEEVINILKKRISGENFYEENWILLYEIKNKNWFADSLGIKEDKYMNLLLEREILFYDDNILAKEEDVDETNEMLILGVSPYSN